MFEFRNIYDERLYPTKNKIGVELKDLNSIL